MATLNKRFMVSLDDELEREFDSLKKELFYDKPMSEMARYLFRLAFEAIRRDDANITDRQKYVQNSRG